jgi:hypothetical protein
MQFSHNQFANDESLDEHMAMGNPCRDGWWEKRMDLPENIRLKSGGYEPAPERWVVITHDVFAAIQATIDLTKRRSSKAHIQNRKTQPCPRSRINPDDRKQPAR